MLLRRIAFDAMWNAAQDSIEFDRVPDEGGKRPDFATHNVALLTLLRPKSVSDGGCICVANAHLFWDPMYEDVKLAQARALVKAAEDMVQESGVQVHTNMFSCKIELYFRNRNIFFKI